MKIASYDIFPVMAGNFALDGGAMFGIVPKLLWEKYINADIKNRITLAMRCLLLCDQTRKILIDTGCGNKFDSKYTEIYKIENSFNALINSLKKNNVNPKDITDVIITHLHFDHAGGISYFNQEKTELTFYNATHHVQKSHWKEANNPNELDKNSYIKEDLELLEKSGKLNLIEGDSLIYPNISLIKTNGHTIGQQIVKIFDENETLVYTSDLIPTTAHIRIPFIMGYDLQPLVIIEEKKKLLKEAFDKKWILFFEHDPKIVMAHVIKKNNDYKAEMLVELI
jgi:glyoxylase-like metal-dependent hydrolase (beta-lactamase superfamily II)